MRRSVWPGIFTGVLIAAVAAGCTVDQGMSRAEPDGAGVTTEARADAGLEEFIAEARERYGSPGAFVLLSKDGTVRFGASGTAAIDGGEITSDSTFRIASITKPIVATMLLMQAEGGSLDLDDPLSSHVSDVVAGDDVITLRMLLDHTSGLYDPQEGDAVADIARLTDPSLRSDAQAVLDQYLAGEQVIASDRVVVGIAETHPRYFEPGTGFYYSNTNYQVLGMVLAAKTGESLATALDEMVARPLGLSATTIAPPDLVTPDVHGYGTDVDDGSLVDITDDLVTFGNGASGGVVSTPSDLLVMIQSIVRGDLVGDGLAAEMRAGTRQSNFSYGLGLGGYETACGLFYGHEGGVNGMASIAMSSVDGSDAVVIGFNLRGAGDPGLPGLAAELLCQP